MTKTKKIIAMLLTIIMTMALAVPAFAAVGNMCNLTVNVKEGNTLKGQTICIYQLFDVANDNGDSYTVSTIYKEVLAEVLGLSVDDPDSKFYQALYVKNAEEIQQFANEFTAKVMEKSIEPTATSDKINSDSQYYTFYDRDYGYYLVYQTGTQSLQSSLVNLKTPEQNIYLKADGQKIDKTANVETIEIGKVITYTITGTVPDTTGYPDYVYKINDEISNGIDFVKDVNGTALDGVRLPVSVKIEGKEKVTMDAVLSNADKKMQLDLSQWVKDNQANKGKTFTVTYYAKANENAVVTNNNSAYLEYSNKPGETVTTTPVVVKTPTYSLDINKIIKDTDMMLAGATFQIYRNEADAKSGTNAIKLTGSNGNYTVAADQNTETNIDMVSVEQKYDGSTNANLHLHGLAAGDYWIVETKAPDGYNKLANPIKVTITKSATGNENDWTISKNDVSEADKIIDIENSTGTTLPETGGIGTIIFTVIAFALIIGVAISFVNSRRKKAK